MKYTIRNIENDDVVSRNILLIEFSSLKDAIVEFEYINTENDLYISRTGQNGDNPDLKKVAKKTILKNIKVINEEINEKIKNLSQRIDSIQSDINNCNLSDNSERIYKIGELDAQIDILIDEFLEEN